MTAARLCHTVTGRSMADLITARDDVRAADIVELRLDGVSDLEVAGALQNRRLPVIVTCRPVWEGGRFDGSEETRQRILRQAVELGAEVVDIEWRAGFDDLVRTCRSQVLLSSHDFDGVPRDLLPRAAEMRAVGTAAIKIAVTTSTLTDTLVLRDIARDGNAVVIGMGDAGVVTRLLASRFGSVWTYAGDGVAPGQIPAARMVDEFRFRDVGPLTRLFGVISRTALHSASPAMHNAAFREAGIDAVYVPLCAADFDDFERFSDAMGIEGASVTIPFKRDALSRAADADALTRSVGAANTLRRRGNAWEATNTDVAGFLAPLEPAIVPSLDGVRAAVLGAGGSARAVIVGLRSRGALVSVHARREEHAREVAASLGASSGPFPPPPGSWDLLVNTTPLGGAALREESPLPGGPFDGRVVYDLTYGPGESRLVSEARHAGLQTLDGLAMLAAQAELQFEWWTGRRPSPGLMLEAAERRLGRGTVMNQRG